MLKYIWISFVLALGTSVSAQISVDNTTFTVDQLVETVLFEDNGCTNVSNIQFSTGTGTGNNGIAYFEANNSGFSLNDGRVYTVPW